MRFSSHDPWPREIKQPLAGKLPTTQGVVFHLKAYVTAQVRRQVLQAQPARATTPPEGLPEPLQDAPGFGRESFCRGYHLCLHASEIVLV